MARRRTPPRGYRPVGSAFVSDRVEDAGGVDYRVRRVAGSHALKVYRCPGCDQQIAVGVAHVVVWPAELVDGGVDDRRHWHTSCWSNRGNRRPTRRWS